MSNKALDRNGVLTPSTEVEVNLEVQLVNESSLAAVPPLNGEPKAIVQHPPLISAEDTDYFNTREGFGLPSTFYPYQDASGVVVGYIVRWDVKLASGGTKKEVRPYIYDFTAKKWKSKFFGQGLANSRPLYNLLELLERSQASVMIVEGEKTAEAAKVLFPELVIVTSSGGANAANKTDWHHLKGRDIIVAPDDGEAGVAYLAAVKKELKRVNTKINKILEPSKLSPYVVQDGVLTERQGAMPKGYDLADSLLEGWTSELITIAQTDIKFTPFFKDVARPPVLRQELQAGEERINLFDKTYKLTPYGLYLGYKTLATEADLAVYPDHDYGVNDLALGIAKEAWLPLCGYLKPVYQITDADNSWGMLVKIKNIDHVEKEIFLKRTDWLGEKGAVEVLQDQGLHLRGLDKKNFNLINEYLNEFKPEFKAVGVDMVGWQGDNSTYMLPFADDARNTYTCTKEGEEPIQYILQQKGIVTRSIRRKGTLEKWQDTVGQVTRGNHLHTFAILTALTAPSLKLLGEEGGFIHYAGSTSIGKSTILHVAKSVWGFDNLETFRITDNALESSCKNANDGMLFLDEIGEVDPKALDSMVYMVPNGSTKGRADRSGNAKATSHFTVLVQSSGELGLEAKLAEKNKQAKGGQLMRMTELDADLGLGLNTFNVLNINPATEKPFTTGKEQAEYLKLHAQANGGMVIDGYLKESVKDIEGFVSDLKIAKLEWLQGLSGNEGAEVARTAKKFSTIFANGVMAVEFKIIPHTVEEVKQCVDAMFLNWLNRFGGDSSYELKMVIADLYKLVIEQQYSRFCNANISPDARVNQPKDIAGYYKMEPNDKGEMVLSEAWVRPTVFEREVLKGRDKKVFYPLLVENGYLVREDTKNYPQIKRPAKESPQRFIVVNIATLLECN